MAGSLSSLLPDEMTTEILARLPSKSLIRFKGATKRWMADIESIRFNLFRMQSPRNHQLIFEPYPPSANFAFLRQERDSGYTVNIQQSPFRSPLYGSCNGLLCIAWTTFGSSKNFFLWNPATRQRIDIERQHPFTRDKRVDIGFGFCPRRNDYFIARRVNKWSWKNKLFIVQLWKMSSNSWTELDILSKVYSGYDIKAGSESIVLQGKWYSLWFNKEKSVIIICFRFDGEVFSCMEIPNMCYVENYSTPMQMNFLEHKDSLVFCLESGSPQQFQIWILKEDESSWVKLITLGPFVHSMRLLGHWMNFMFTEKEDSKNVYEYDDATQDFKVIVRDLDVISRVHKYLESLVPLQ